MTQTTINTGSLETEVNMMCADQSVFYTANYGLEISVF